MFSAFHDAKLRFCRDESERLEHLGNRSEGVVFTVYKKGGNNQPAKVGGAQLIGLFWRMERIGKQQESIGNMRILRGQDAGLTAAVGVTAEINPARYVAAQLRGCRLQSFPVISGVSWERGAEASLPAKWKIEAQHKNAGSRKSVCNRNKQGRATVPARSVSERQGILRLTGWHMEKAVNRIAAEGFNVRHA